MLNGRLYRAAFLPFLLALAVAAFSLGGRPAALTSTLAPDAFQGQRAFAELRTLLAQHPQRRPGSSGDEALAGDIARSLRGLGGTAGGGFTVHVRRIEGQTIDGEKGLATVVAERPGSTSEAPVLIVAHRDAAAPGSAAELSGTAALLELARVFAARETKRTIILVSTSGGSGGNTGAAELTTTLGSAGIHGPFDAAIVLGDLASRGARRPFVVPYSDGFGSAPLGLQRTVADAIKHEAGWDPGSPSTFGQLAHLMFPMAVGEQGVLDAQGLPAVLVQASSERGPAPGAAVSMERLEGLGRAVLSSVDALDAAPDISQAPQTGLLLQRKTMPEWALRLLLGTLLLPPLVAGADGLARLRRRREPVGRWTLWTLSCALPFLCCALLCWLLGQLGIIDAAPSVPVPPRALPFDGAAGTTVAVVGLTFVLSWLLWGVLLRRAGLPGRPDPEVAGLPIVLLLSGLGTVVWLANPYTALLILPAMHLWLALAAPELRPRRPVAVTLVVLALLPLILLIVFFSRQLGLGIGSVAWGAVLLVAGGHVGLGSAVLWSLGLGCAAGATLLAVLAPPAPMPQNADGVEVTIRGPMSYAGPGSLGGTESALRR
jgi:Peptidase family M28